MYSVKSGYWDKTQRRVLVYSVLLLIFACKDFKIMVDAFNSPSHNHRHRISNGNRNVFPTRKGHSNLRNIRKNEELKTSNLDNLLGWDLQEDWLLSDQVPLFTMNATSRIDTVGEAMQERTVTFWTQLKHSTPILSVRSEDDLESRYRLLLQREMDEANKKCHVNDEKKGKKKMMTPCGKSPELLTKWWIENRSYTDDHRYGNMMVGGILLNGSRIWFPLSKAGTLNGNRLYHLDYLQKDTYEEWNYAESIGGQIYELGIRCKVHASEKNFAVTSMSSTAHKDIVPWLSSRTQSISAIFVASILSALVAFSTDPLNRSSLLTTSQATQTPIVVNVQSSRQSSLLPLTAPSSTQMASDVTELSISAQRARQELKVERDKMTVERVQDRLKMDELKLKELIKEENKQEAIKYGFL